MNDYDNEERRKDYPTILTDIALIKQKIEFISEAIDKVEKSVSKHVCKDEFSSHIIQDRWMFGVIITLLVSVVLKLFIAG